MGTKSAVAGVLLVSVFFGSRPAHAEDTRDPAAAEALFREGRSAAQKKDFSTACAKFRESNRLDPAVGTVFNIADCEEKLGRLATSWTLFQEVVQRLPNDDNRRAIAGERAHALEARIPTLNVHLAPSQRAEVVVRRDGVVLGGASLDTALPVDPGEHTVIVEAPGTERVVFTRRVGEGEHATLTVAAGRVSMVSPPPRDTAQSSSPRSSHAAAYVLGGIGVAGVVTGVIAGLTVLSKKSTVDAECVGSKCSPAGLDAARTGKTYGVVTTLGLSIGAVGLGTAAYLFLSAPPLENPHSSAYVVGFRAKW